MKNIVFKKFILGTGEYLDEALHNGLGGVIFFTRDIQSKIQFQNLIKEIQSKRSDRLFLSIDQEGGRVERTENIHERYLSARDAFRKGLPFLEQQTRRISEELKEYGINLNFAPCADVNTNPNNPIIGERAFSGKTEEVIKCVNLVCKIYRENGIIPCVKHYPGHGDADKDSHKTLPQIKLSMEEMVHTHIAPFKSAVSNNIEMIMAAHLHCECFDKDVIPSSLSKNAIGYLRNELNYSGVIISDDMVMKGVQDYGITEALIMGIKAGVDMFIFRDSDEKTYNAILELINKTENDSELKQKILESDIRIDKLLKNLQVAY